jgi:hypothetical protein
MCRTAVASREVERKEGAWRAFGFGGGAAEPIGQRTRVQTSPQRQASGLHCRVTARRYMRVDRAVHGRAAGGAHARPPQELKTGTRWWIGPQYVLVPSCAAVPLMESVFPAER